MKLMFVLSAAFFIAALCVQTRHDFASKSFRDEKIWEFDRKLIAAELPPYGERARADVIRSLERTKEIAEAKAKGESTPGTILYRDWVEEKKKEDTTILYFLYGAGILFTFGGIMKLNGGKNISEPA